MKIKISTLLLLSLSLMAGLISCKKDKDEDHHNHHSATVNLVINPVIGAQTFVFNTNFTDQFGTVYQFTRAEFYLSNIVFMDDVGATAFTPGKYFVVRPTTATYALGTTSAHHLHDMNFVIGVDSVTNHSDPSTYPAGSALAAQVPSLHWSWSTGYVFLAIEGIADRNNDGVAESAFQMHIGTDALRKALSLEVHRELVDGNNSIAIKIDYSKLFIGIDLSDPNSQTHTMDNMTLATQIKNNLDSVFTVQ